MKFCIIKYSSENMTIATCNKYTHIKALTPHQKTQAYTYVVLLLLPPARLPKSKEFVASRTTVSTVPIYHIRMISTNRHQKIHVLLVERSTDATYPSDITKRGLSYANTTVLQAGITRNIEHYQQPEMNLYYRKYASEQLRSKRFLRHLLNSYFLRSDLS